MTAGSRASGKRFVLTAFSDAGHLNPFVAIAERLERRGHDVTIVSCQNDVSARLCAAGLRARCVTLPRGPDRGLRAPASAAELTERLRNPAWMARWLSLVLLDPVPAQVAALRAVIRELQPDVVATDAMAYAGAAAAELEGFPWAAIATGLQSWPSDLPGSSAGVFDKLARPRAEIMAALGMALTFQLSDVVSPRLNVLLAPPTLLGDAPPSRRATAVGAALPLRARGDAREFPWDALPYERPLVYVAFGSHLSPPPSVYEAITAALGPDEAFFVLALKDLATAPFVSSLPEHVLAVGYAPQLELVARAHVAVNHGGASSVMESLSAGTPMIAVPLCYDQPIWAKLVEDAGVGIAMDVDSSAAQFRDALLRLLRSDAPERKRAKAFAEAGDGAERAADLLVELAMSDEGGHRRREAPLQ